ncbi:MAG: hypothetical protein CBC42_01200 [Betaproteobacteria bacterium TMED82]|mgnify:CR=1 FL=1|nr:MAG: hypothetical protein CBC42_01200 [Betaproteobacteria bacterium TMED82]|tara:strand:- start:50972 stop:51172 length:201 start_codon:yes stop_codon:yes gene_type:complete
MKKIFLVGVFLLALEACATKSDPTQMEKCVLSGMADWADRSRRLKEVRPESEEKKIVMELCARGLL